jgi:hypothetical protein
MSIYRNSRIVSISDRNPLYTEFSIFNTPGISKYRIFFFEAMFDAEASDIRIGPDDNAGLQPHLVYYPSKQVRTPTLVRKAISPPEEALKDKSRVLMNIADIHPELTQKNMLFAINQEYCIEKDANGNAIGWLPPSPIQIILPPSFPVSEVQRPHLGITAIAPMNPNPEKLKSGKIPIFGDTVVGGVEYYTTVHADSSGALTSGVLHYTVPTYSRSSFIHNHHPTENLLLSFHPKFPLFIVEPENIICLSGGMDTDVVAVSGSAVTPVEFTIGFGLSKT